MKVLYTAEVTSVNGRNGNAKSSDGLLDVKLVAPKALGGAGNGGTNPEQLFAAGYVACFTGAMQYEAQQQKIDPGEIKIVSQVDIGPQHEGEGFTIAVRMDITAAKLDQAAAGKLVEDAHKTCPYSNATRGNIDVTLTAHGGKSS